MKKRGSIKKELRGIILFIVLFTFGVGYIVFVASYTHMKQVRHITTAKTIGHLIGQDVAKIIFQDDISTASDVANKLKSFKNLCSVILYTKDKGIIFQYSKDKKIHKFSIPKDDTLNKPITKGDELFFIDRIYYKNVPIAMARYVFKIESLSEIFLDDLPILLLILIGAILLSYTLSGYYSNKFTKPIIELVKFLENVENKDFLQKRLKTDKQDEFGILYEEINTVLSKLEENYKKLQIAAVAFETQSAMVITDKNNKILQVNKAFEKITGYKESEVIGQTPSILKSGKYDDEFYEDMYQILNTEHYWSGEISNRKKDGTLYTEYLILQTVLDSDGNIAYYVASFIDITKQKEMETKLHFLESYDSLTGLINKNLLEEELKETIKNSKDKIYGFICLDIENFRFINEAYSYSFGDKLLVAFANAIKENWSSAKYISRLGVDEFFLCFEFDKDKIEDVNFETMIKAQKYTNITDNPFTIDDKKISISLRMGISILGYDEQKSVKQIIQDTISAKNLAKEQGEVIAFYDKEYQNKTLKYIDKYAELQLAILNEEFRLFYQLQYDNNGKPIGAEALIRWIKDGKVISPADFVPLLEKSNLILRLNNWILETACKQLATWQKDEKTKDLIISINVTAKEFDSPLLLSNIRHNLRKYNIPSGLLKIELLESMLVTNLKKVIIKMREIRRIGVHISLDDFGTGYSSLSYLKKLPIDQLKIDQSFVKDLKDNEKDKAVIKSILSLREAFNIDIIAEGVETKEILDILISLGCNHFQGYYFAKPKPIEEITL